MSKQPREITGARGRPENPTSALYRTPRGAASGHPSSLLGPLGDPVPGVAIPSRGGRCAKRRDARPRPRAPVADALSSAAGAARAAASGDASEALLVELAEVVGGGDEPPFRPASGSAAA